jgi:hypothetical protein
MSNPNMQVAEATRKLQAMMDGITPKFPMMEMLCDKTQQEMIAKWRDSIKQHINNIFVSVLSNRMSPAEALEQLHQIQGKMVAV